MKPLPGTLLEYVRTCVLYTKVRYVYSFASGNIDWPQNDWWMDAPPRLEPNSFFSSFLSSLERSEALNHRTHNIMFSEQLCKR